MGERHVRIEISDFVMRTFVLIPGISLRDVSGISTKAPREAARVHEPHVRAEIADFVTRRTYGETCHIRQVRADISDFVTRAFALRSACRQAQDEIHSKRRN